MVSRARIAVVGTGGSIATFGRHSLDLYEYGDHADPVGVDVLLRHFPEVLDAADLEPHTLQTLKSVALTSADWITLLKRLDALTDRETPPSGIVITHGTSTLEETAYFLHLTLKTEIPVVLVGAQRPPNSLGSDAGINLLNAIRTAAADECRGLGVLVVMNDEIHSARDVTKSSNYRLHAFQSPGSGPLGHVDPDGNVAISRRPARRFGLNSAFDLRDYPARLPRVDIAFSYVDNDGAAVKAFVEAGARGIVSAAFAPGRLSPAERGALVEAIADGVVVVLSSRAQTGRVLDPDALLRMGMIGADDLTPVKARILTSLALTLTSDRCELRQMFREY